MIITIRGDSIDITIEVVNLGPADATNVVVKDVLPTGLKQVSCTGCAGVALRQATRQSSHTITFATTPRMSTYVVVEISPDTTTRPVFTSVSQATLPSGAARTS